MRDYLVCIRYGHHMLASPPFSCRGGIVPCMCKAALQLPLIWPAIYINPLCSLSPLPVVVIFINRHLTTTTASCIFTLSLSQLQHSSLVNHRFLHTHTHPLTCLFVLPRRNCHSPSPYTTMNRRRSRKSLVMQRLLVFRNPVVCSGSVRYSKIKWPCCFACLFVISKSNNIFFSFHFFSFFPKIK